VVRRCKELTTPTGSHELSLSHGKSDQSPLPITSPGGYETSVDYVESSVDAEATTVLGEGLKELQEDVKLLEERCAKVEDKLRRKEVALGDRKTTVENYDKDFNTFHRGLDHVTEELAKSQPVLNDDDAVKEQIMKTGVSILFE